MKHETLHFVGPRRVEVRYEAVPTPMEDQVLVQTELTAISAGTEMLLFRGEIPEGAETHADSISKGLTYPTSFGYSAVGTVVRVGNSVDRMWLGRTVFGFQAHASHFLAHPASLLEVPPGLVPEEAVFLPNGETAVNLVQDAAPIIGERALVLGQGVVGLLTAALLREFPLECLVTADRFLGRRIASEEIGVSAALDPAEPDFKIQATDRTGSERAGFDLTIELTGNPGALDDAIALTAFGGRVVIGSWYGNKKVPIDLGGRYHRSRIRLLSSQVSTIAPELSGRWNKSRRFSVAFDALGRIRPSRWITHRFSLDQAVEAYRLLDESPGEAIQVIFQYA